MIKHIFFDFNGTLIDDVNLCLELLNGLLASQGKASIDLKRYKQVFKFPIKDYYLDAGIDFSIESFESMAVRFIDEYQPKSLLCGLYEGVVDTIKELREKGIKTYILSASEKNNLIEQCKHYKIVDLFDDILGIDNIHAGSKLDIALEYMKSSNINKNEAMFVGDTLHDYEVARAMGVGCVLVSCGHQCVEVLGQAGVPIVSSIKDIIREV